MTNILMFTPALQPSAIGRVATLIVHELKAQGHHVTVVRAETEHLLTEQTHPFDTPIVPWTDSAGVEILLQEADTVVYQIGDHYDYHRGCLEWMPRHPGIVCLHDYFLGNLFWMWAQRNQAKANATLKAWYGDEIAESYFRQPSSEVFIASTSKVAPMTEWAASMALGVISHSNWGAPRLQRACPGPVQIVPLPYNAPAVTSNATSMHHDGKSFNILTVGHVNPNKRVASVIQAIGRSAMVRERSVYRVVGQIQTPTVLSLSSLARNFQVNLVISDSIDNMALVNAFEQADVILCLRWPSLEAASASAIEAMLYGKPVIVTNVHFYSEIPDDCVIKIDPDDEISSVQTALETLLADPVLRQEMAERARRWAQSTFRADYYAEQLVAMGANIRAIRPVVEAIDWHYQTLSSWGATQDLLACDAVREPLRLLSR